MEKIEIELGTSDSIVHTFRYYSERKLRDDVDDSRVIDCHLEFLPWSGLYLRRYLAKGICLPRVEEKGS